MIKFFVGPVIGIAIAWAFLTPVSLIIEHNKYNPSTKSFRLM